MDNFPLDICTSFLSSEVHYVSVIQRHAPFRNLPDTHSGLHPKLSGIIPESVSGHIPEQVSDIIPESVSDTSRNTQLSYVEYAPILAEMSGKEKNWPKRYREFVESGLAETDEEFKTALKESPRSIGSDSFRAKIDELYQKLIEKSDVPEDISFRRITEPLEPEKVLDILAEIFEVEVDEFRQRRRGSYLRGVAARYLSRYSGQTQREVAQLLNIGTGAAVSQQMKKLSARLSDDRKFSKMLKKVDGKLDELRRPED